VPYSVDRETSVASPEVVIALREQLDRLAQFDDASIELLMRRYLLGETAIEIADTLQCSPAAVRMRLKRLRSSIRRAIEAAHRTPSLDLGDFRFEHEGIKGRGGPPQVSEKRRGMNRQIAKNAK
jgi:hypothetical protein